MPFSFIRKFLRLESAGGILLFAAAVLALILSNTPLHDLYEEILHTTFSVQLGELSIKKPLILWINEGLMAIFFLSVGLEIKRELIVGELNSLQKISLPGIAALGGIIVPAIIYYIFNVGDYHALRGWAIPTATDIAFALGVLSLLGSRVPLSLKIFLTALAIFDDLAAIVIIAAFYTADISIEMLFFAALCITGLIILNMRNVVKQEAYFFLGFLLWVCVLKSGVHATLAGVAIALAIPMKVPQTPDKSPLHELEMRLLPWVSYLVLPVFAFANAGVSFKGLSMDHIVGPIPLGIALGLLVGKQVGIFGASFLAIKLGISTMPTRATWLGLYAVSIICGIGFTMSLFIGTLAFPEVGTDHTALVRIGVLSGSTIAGLIGLLILRVACRDEQTP